MIGFYGVTAFMARSCLVSYLFCGILVLFPLVSMSVLVIELVVWGFSDICDICVAVSDSWLTFLLVCVCGIQDGCRR